LKKRKESNHGLMQFATSEFAWKEWRQLGKPRSH